MLKEFFWIVIFLPFKLSINLGHQILQVTGQETDKNFAWKMDKKKWYNSTLSRDAMEGTIR